MRMVSSPRRTARESPRPGSWPRRGKPSERQRWRAVEPIVVLAPAFAASAFAASAGARKGGMVVHDDDRLQGARRRQAQRGEVAPFAVPRLGGEGAARADLGPVGLRGPAARALQPVVLRIAADRRSGAFERIGPAFWACSATAPWRIRRNATATCRAPSGHGMPCGAGGGAGRAGSGLTRRLRARLGRGGGPALARLGPRPGPASVACASDERALGLISELDRHGERVPRTARRWAATTSGPRPATRLRSPRAASRATRSAGGRRIARRRPPASWCAPAPRRRPPEARAQPCRSTRSGGRERASTRRALGRSFSSTRRRISTSGRP